MGVQLGFLHGRHRSVGVDLRGVLDLALAVSNSDPVIVDGGVLLGNEALPGADQAGLDRPYAGSPLCASR